MSGSPDVQLHRELGELTATHRALVARLEALEAREEKRDQKIDAMYSWMQQAQGSWKTMLMCGAFGAAVSGVLSNVGGILQAMGVRLGGGGH